MGSGLEASPGVKVEVGSDIGPLGGAGVPVGEVGSKVMMLLTVLRALVMLVALFRVLLRGGMGEGVALSRRPYAALPGIGAGKCEEQ